MRIWTWRMNVRREGSDWVVTQSLGNEHKVQFEITYPTWVGIFLSFRWLPPLYKLSKIEPDALTRGLDEINADDSIDLNITYTDNKGEIQ